MTSAKPFDQDNFPKHNPADFKSCARLAGAPAAKVSTPDIIKELSSSLPEGHATCSGTACCIKFN